MGHSGVGSVDRTRRLSLVLLNPQATWSAPLSPRLSARAVNEKLPSAQMERGAAALSCREDGAASEATGACAKTHGQSRIPDDPRARRWAIYSISQVAQPLNAWTKQLQEFAHKAIERRDTQAAGKPSQR